MNTLAPSAPLRASWIKKIEVARIPGCPVPGDCWIWHGCRDKKKGVFVYGRVTVDGRCTYLHRVVYELLVGPIPDGLHIDHLCRQPACCAPYHLEPVTCLVNVRRGHGNGSRTHCPAGHEYSGQNLYIHKSPKGDRRVCRTCRDAAVERHRAKRALQRQQTWAKYESLAS